MGIQQATELQSRLLQFPLYLLQALYLPFTAPFLVQALFQHRALHPPAPRLAASSKDPSRLLLLPNTFKLLCSRDMVHRSPRRDPSLKVLSRTKLLKEPSVTLGVFQVNMNWDRRLAVGTLGTHALQELRKGR